MQEYANDVVGAVLEACNERGLPHPDIVSESGRALVAHHSVLVFNVLDVNEVARRQPMPPAVDADEHAVHQEPAETWRSITRKNFQEAYHDALQTKDEADEPVQPRLPRPRASARASSTCSGAAARRS